MKPTAFPPVPAATLAALAALALPAAHAAGTVTIPPVPVTVTNTPSVTVNGTATVSGTVNVANPVTVQGTVSANITGGSVTATLPSGLAITNPSSSPVLTRNVDDAGRTPYQATAYPSCGIGSCQASFADVPAGGRRRPAATCCTSTPA